jgi:hypothetical protein
MSASLTAVNITLTNIMAANPSYGYTNFTVVADSQTNSVAIFVKGLGGHASSSTPGALDLSIDAFSTLSDANSALEFYLPHNMITPELDFDVDVRSRFTSDLSTVINFVLTAISTTDVYLDIIYPALEVTPLIPEVFINLIGQPEYSVQVFPMSPPHMPRQISHGCSKPF